MNFLTNKSIKMVRSAEEGNMIVYLSGISFTPNRQLSNQVYNFSATVTEVAPATDENLKKYNFNFAHGDVYAYTLDVTTDTIQDAMAVINANWLINQGANSQITLMAREVGKLA